MKSEGNEKNRSEQTQNVATTGSPLPFGLPPVLSDLQDDIERHFLHPEQLSVLYNLDQQQTYLPRKANPECLYQSNLTPLQTTIKVERNQTTGEMLGFKEDYLTGQSSTAQNSLSLSRQPGPLDQVVRGSSTNYPFWPGGLDFMETVDKTLSTQLKDNDFDTDLLTMPPGFEKGMQFEKNVSANTSHASVGPNTLNIVDILSGNDDFEFDDSSDEDARSEDDPNDRQTDTVTRSSSLENLVQNVAELKRGDKQNLEQPTEEWAVTVDISHPVNDFYKKIPEMACSWPFEPDTFQKQAILHLEDHDSVFVAAHTSAGKTVVAEYAIALSLKHMTRTIYTSPIKALSNQKFREFKHRFSDMPVGGDVGLITGDVQLKPDASCLIMTTEILRSMLYNGSDVIRDLEWVIFDEVHYINDAERGVVWEEVLIMLPEHVNIILLSATVPNTKEFADWIGRTKRKKIYVISTLKRPVPLEHYLYTGNSNKTSNELFVIVDSERKFITKGYNKALEAKKERATKSSQSYGAKGTRGGHPQQDKGVWLSVIEMLRKKDKLPVIAFIFSKKKIDENAANLRSVDLTTEKEKSEIHLFFHKSVSRLRGTDKDLPQVLQMQDLLKRGVGVHHSGILPILKEVVEMLFQKGLVKILFSTETFAMGVNMPARTVLFDTIRKNDGTQFRDLLPGEYIQMAGRAGRRGLDTTGTVIILCKGDVPELSDLHKMMLGMPTKLESRFRLTYSMILNLLRVEQLRVEDMMKRSFSEFNSQKKRGKHQEVLTSLKEQIKNMKPIECYICCSDLENYHKACQDYSKLKNKLQKLILTHPTAVKCLNPGRIAIVRTLNHDNVLAVLLAVDSKTRERTFTFLCLSELNDPVNMDNNRTAENKDRTAENKDIVLVDWFKPKPFSNDQKLFIPEGPAGHVVLQLKSENICDITAKTLKINAERIIEDFRKRLMPRFRNDPLGQSTVTTVQELLRLTEANPDGLPSLDPVKDLNIRDVDTVEEFRRLQFMTNEMDQFQCVHCPTFQTHFDQMSENLKIEDQLKKIKFLLSDESLMLLPEYQQRIQVLKSLNYIDNLMAVQMKGRVACEISNHELLITELIFENVLTRLHPTEIAALLSCVVFEQKNCSEPNWTNDLLQGQKDIVAIARMIGEQQQQAGMTAPVEDYVSGLKFGLVEVVFEWARGVPFSDIMKLTDVQEGIIVRCIQRLDETLRDVRNAARIIGDPVLYDKAVESSSAIKRDIVFAASLYTQ